MPLHKIEVIVPEDRRVVVEFPETIRTGPAELLVFTPSQAEEDAAKSPSPQALARWETMRAELAADPRPFRELSLAERRSRLRRLRGIGRGLLSSSDDFARRKLEEIELEERKFGR